MSLIRRIVLSLLLCLPAAVGAQDRGTLDPKPLPALAHPDDPALAAKELFGRRDKPAAMPPHSIGGYARGCLAGATAIPIDGDTWQVMRLSRNRNWGHPDLIAFLQHLSAKLPRINGWPGLLIGDISQPRGGPMITGHASHQIGLDADLWFTPMPSRRLSRAEREEMSATNVVRPDGLDIDPQTWTPQHTALLRTAAMEHDVARVFVNPAIKKALCREAGQDRAWLRKIRPTFGHNYHFHVRIACPNGSSGCADQDPPPPGDGCGAELAQWFTPEMLHPKPGKPRPPLTVAQLPVECRRVLAAP
ncbi:penicillin-insensitive murein endopeptidase [Microvirga puerhi]|uniref:Penicillin-insensitive murein endopeptidase n=1 Tax=Microvirga puerhi TaxID=2876078 RepID=A0ABS7VML0_9HYPH|nr:penicillin-insensitive murein endopeptidase [Microvirga puerhi]MBZ6076761.1 penicillin-insensitive murein endopeptidase [Microvirga puerhi]